MVAWLVVVVLVSAALTALRSRLVRVGACALVMVGLCYVALVVIHLLHW